MSGTIDPRTAADPSYRLERIVARLLRVGTWIAISLVFAGVAGMLLAGVEPLSPGAPAFSLVRIPGDVLALRPEGFLWAGLVAVIALPLGRVLVAGTGFLAAGDRRLAFVSACVLLVVTASVIAALALDG